MCSIAQSCLILCDLMDCRLPGFPVHEFFQARILEQVAISYSWGSSWPRGQTQVSCVSCIGRRILYHCAIWEAQYSICSNYKILAVLPMEKAMAPHSSTLAWKIPWMEGPGGLQSMGSLRGMTERLHFHFSLACIGAGNGNPLQCSCLENPRDGGAWWAAVYGIAQSWTRQKRLSSSTPHVV